MKTHFEQLAVYNRWANARLYEAALTLAEADYQRDTGVFFKSMSGTLNHLLVTDRNWMWRLTGEGLHYDRGDIIILEDRRKLVAARADEDERILRYVASLDEAALEGLHSYPPPRTNRSYSGVAIFLRTSLIITPTIAAKRTRSFPSSRGESRHRWTCLLSSAVWLRLTCGR